MKVGSFYRRGTALIYMFGLSASIVACSNGDNDSVSESETSIELPSASSKQSSTRSSTSIKTPEPTIATETVSPQNDTSGAENGRGEELQGMESVDPLIYTGNGNSTLAGTRFVTTDGSVNCHVKVGVGCVVEEHQPWPVEDRANDGIKGDRTPNVIGWHSGVQANY